MALRTYGDKPKSFQITENGEYYCMGSEVGNYLGFFRGTLYKRYPGMFRRSVTNEERKKLVKLGLNQYVPTSVVCLVRAREVEDIIKGNDHKYKIASSDLNELPLLRKGKSEKPTPWLSSLPNNSHLDLLPQVTSIKRKRVYNKKVRTFPPCFDDMGPSASFSTAGQQKILMPMQFDGVIQGQELRNNFTWNNNAKQDSRREDFIAIETAADITEIAGNLANFETAHKYDCRICLKNSDKFWEIFQTQNLPQKIMAVAFVQVQYGDGLPSVICFACRKLLDMLYDFKYLIEESDATLRNTLLSRMKINHDTVQAPLSEPIHNEFQMQYESQLLNLQNFNHMVSNDYDSKQNLVSYQIHEECINNNNRLPKEKTLQKNRNNRVLNNQKYLENDNDSSEPEIIAISDDSKILLEHEGGPLSKLIDIAGQTMESELVPIKQEELFLPKESDMLEGENSHWAHETIFQNGIKYELENNSLLVEEERVDDVSSSSTLETMDSKVSIEEINDSKEDKLSILRLSQQKCPHCIQSFATNVDLQTHMTIHQDMNKFRYNCYWCEKQFFDIGTLINHVSNNHNSSNNNNRVDIDSNYGRMEGDKKVEELVKDIGGSINKQIVEKKDYKLKCEVGATQFTHQESFLSHIKTHPEYEKFATAESHSKQLERQNDLSNFEINESDNEDLQLEGLQCNQCDKLFTMKGNPKRHILTHNGLRFNCSTCRQEFSRDKLKDHEQSKYKKKIFGPSDDEDGDTDNERKLSDRTEFRRKEKKCGSHQCAMFPKAYAKPPLLTNHMERYNRAKESQERFLCTVCSKCFAQSGSLVAHMRTHTGVKTHGAQCIQ